MQKILAHLKYALVCLNKVQRETVGVPVFRDLEVIIESVNRMAEHAGKLVEAEEYKS